MRGFKFVTALVLEFKKIVIMKQNIVLFIQTQKQKQLLIVFESVYIMIKSNIQRSLRKGSHWIIDSVIDHNNISKRDLLN